MDNAHDDWEVAVDTGEFDKRLEQLEKDRAATQVIVLVRARNRTACDLSMTERSSIVHTRLQAVNVSSD